MAEQRVKRPSAEQTKARILSAAKRLFTAEGYERTTIRAVAAAADIDPSMVMRYFDSKEGLFAAAASVDLQLPDLSTVPRRGRGKRLAEHYLQLWRGDAAGGGLPILLRTAATNEKAAEQVRRNFRRQVLPVIAKVAPDAPSARAALIASQLLGLAYARYVVRIPELTALDEATIASSLGRTIQRYLDGPINDA